MLVFNFFDDERTQLISYVNSFPMDASNANTYYYGYNIEKERVEFYGNSITVYFCVESKSWLPFEADIDNDSGFMTLKNIVVK